MPIASVPIRKKAHLPNEPTAKLINACGKWSYENARPMGKPPKAKSKPVTTPLGGSRPVILFHLVEVGLKLAHLVGDEAKGMVQGEVFDIRLVVLGLVAKFVEFGKDRFGLHQCFPSAASAPKSDNALERCSGLVARYLEPWSEVVSPNARRAES